MMDANKALLTTMDLVSYDDLCKGPFKYYVIKEVQGSIFLQMIDNSARMHIQKDIILPRIFIISKNSLWFQS